MGILAKGKAIPETKEKETTELELEDVLALSGGEEETQDLDANPNDRPLPLPPGEYIFKLILNPQKKVTSKSKQDRPTSYTIPIIAIVDDTKAGDYNGRRVDYYANTSKGMSSISRVAYLLSKMGILTGNSISQEDQARLLVLALKQEPKIKGQVDWEASYASGEGEDKTYITPKYKGKRLNTAENFPVIEGELQHEVEITDEDGGTRTVMARPQLIDFVKKTQPVVLPTTTTKKVAKKEETEEPKEETTPAKASTGGEKKKIVIPSGDDV